LEQARVMIVEVHPDFRELMADLIGRQADLEVVAHELRFRTRLTEVAPNLELALV
jgi:hypothetical protein